MTTNHSVVQGRELKSCPFCGGEAYLSGGAITWNAGCKSCTASVGGMAGVNLQRTAIAHWNTRAQTPVAQGRDERREAFESWAEENRPYDLHIGHIGIYLDLDAASDFDLWQAAWQRAQTPREEAKI